MDGVVAQQMRVGVHGAQIVDADDLEIVAPALDQRAQDQAADAPEPVDGKPNRHELSPLVDVEWVGGDGG